MDNNEVRNKIKNNVIELIKNGAFDDAKELLEEYKKISSEDIDINSMEGIIYIHKNNIKEAEKTLKEGLEIDYKNYDLHYNLAYCYEVDGNIEEAIRSYRRAWFYSDEQVNEKDLFMKIYSLEYKCGNKKEVEKIYEYYNQIQEFVLRRLSGQNNISYKNVVKQKKPIRKRKLRALVVHGKNIEQIYNYKEELINKELDIYVLKQHESIINDSSDFYMDIDNIEQNELIKLALLIAEFDEFHLFNNKSLLVQGEDLYVIKELNRKIIMN